MGKAWVGFAGFVLSIVYDEDEAACLFSCEPLCGAQVLFCCCPFTVMARFLCWCFSCHGCLPSFKGFPLANGFLVNISFTQSGQDLEEIDGLFNL